MTATIEAPALTQAQRERAFFRRCNRTAPRLSGTITPRRPSNDTRPHAEYVADLIATFCPHEPKCETFGRVSCPEGFEAANRAINAEYAKRNRLALANGGGNLVGRIAVVTEDSPEGRRIIAERAERIVRQEKRDGFDADLAALIGVL